MANEEFKKELKVFIENASEKGLEYTLLNESDELFSVAPTMLKDAIVDFVDSSDALFELINDLAIQNGLDPIQE